MITVILTKKYHTPSNNSNFSPFIIKYYSEVVEIRKLTDLNKGSQLKDVINVQVIN